MVAIMRPSVVLDKSFLQGSDASRIRAMGESHHLLMSDALFYEILSNPKKRVCDKFMGDKS